MVLDRDIPIRYPEGNRCPYCGNNMIVKEGELFDGSIYTYQFCVNCETEREEKKMKITFREIYDSPITWLVIFSTLFFVVYNFMFKTPWYQKIVLATCTSGLVLVVIWTIGIIAMAIIEKEQQELLSRK